MSLNLEDFMRQPVTVLKGVGPALHKKLSLLNVNNLQDLLFLVPKRYVDKTRVVPLSLGYCDQHVQIEGSIIASKVIKLKNTKQQMIITIIANDLELNIVFFYFNSGFKNKFAIGSKIRCFGELKYKKNIFQMIHPEINFLHNEEILPVNDTYTPIYPTVNGLSQSTIYNLMQQLFNNINFFSDKLELFNSDILNAFNLPNFFAACKLIHFPENHYSLQELNAINLGISRLALEELVAHRVKLEDLRQVSNICTDIPNIEFNQILHNAFIDSLPYKLTDAQIKVINECISDFYAKKPMRRLIQGDVGSGKTIVSFCIALHAMSSNYQVALMVPTEVLARQHFVTIKTWCENLNITASLLYGKMPAVDKKIQRNMILEGKVNIIIGTHVLFQDDVIFNNLGLIIIDEQHRFGVEQRLLLQNKSKSVHQLMMTATPIPRSLAMILCSDMDYSIIDQLPQNRIPVATFMVSQKRKAQMLDKIKQITQSSQQVYWICSLITESEQINAEPAEKAYSWLIDALPELRIGMVHGQLNTHEKELVMTMFKEQELNVLVATTVIEVGVDVPNANLIIIENPERLGLSQIHQLRGRVGRGVKPGYCILLYGNEIGATSLKKLDLLRTTNDGFKIAEADLNFRGGGDILGTKQTGLPSYRIADVVRDKDLLIQVKKIADLILSTHRELIRPLSDRWIEKKIECMDV